MAIDVTVITPKTRFIVVHYHLFKNAGTTIERVLEREFPGRLARLHGPTPDARLDGEDLAAFLADHPGVDAITSHHLRYPLPVVRSTVLFDCCFLRHPLDRLASLYSYFRKIDSSDPMSRSARRQTPVEFFRQLMDCAPHQVSNTQVTQLATAGAFTRPANLSDLDRAIGFMRDMAMPGLVEMFDESMVAAEHFMRPAFSSLRLSSRAHNVSRTVLADADEREQRLIRFWGADLHRELTRLNEFDIELCHQTGREIRHRLSLVPANRERLAEFGSRCVELTLTASAG